MQDNHPNIYHTGCTGTTSTPTTSIVTTVVAGSLEVNQKINVSDLEVRTVKARGRPKRKALRAIGLPASKKPKAFSDYSREEKCRRMLTRALKCEIKPVLNKERVVDVCDVQDHFSDALLDGNVDVKL